MPSFTTLAANNDGDNGVMHTRAAGPAGEAGALPFATPSAHQCDAPACGREVAQRMNPRGPFLHGPTENLRHGRGIGAEPLPRAQADPPPPLIPCPSWVLTPSCTRAQATGTGGARSAVPPHPHRRKKRFEKSVVDPAPGSAGYGEYRTTTKALAPSSNCHCQLQVRRRPELEGPSDGHWTP